MILSDILLKDKLVQFVTSKEKVAVSKTNDNFNVSLIATDFVKNDQSLFVVASNIFTAQKYYDELINILPEEDVLFFPSDELLTVEMLAMTGDFKYERINTILTLLETNKKKVIVTHLNGIIKYELPKKVWQENVLKFKTGDTVDIEFLTSKLIMLGYEKTYTTIKTGQFSRRGSIVDIFPLNYDNPIRLDFFDDEIDVIKEYSNETQLSISKIHDVVVSPVTELLYSESEKKAALEKFDTFMKQHKNLSQFEKEKYEKDRISLEERTDTDMMMRYLSFFSKERTTIFDFVKNYKTYLLDKDKIKSIYNHVILDLEDYCSGIGGYSLLDLDYFRDITFIESLESVVTIEGLNSLEQSVEISTEDIPSYNGDKKLISEVFTKLVRSKTVILFSTSTGKTLTLVDLFRESKIPYIFPATSEDITAGSVNIVKEYGPSFIYPDFKYYFINADLLIDRIKRKKHTKYKSIFKNAVKIKRYSELSVGDYIVHYNYGIGEYLGVVCKNVGGYKRDYLHIEYANHGKLFVPLEQIDLIQKFQDKGGLPPKLNSLGSSNWTKEKLRVRKKLRDISGELIELYAKRKQSKGIEFDPDTFEQEQFENEFEYMLTPDQNKAVKEIKRDMESSKPMDRLVCGDVGYGKTEVALRAAFKAVMSGYQVALLAPTTILSRQHYYTFLNRMDKYGVKVKLLNRFISPKESKNTLLGLERGDVDIIVGTHKLLSNSVKYRRLGLLIIDEEQRFGVTHKEKIKKIKINVDSITLTATPIPRTLQMSIVGIKDMSLIETPPKNRYPIQTYVLERNDTIIQQAIEREISRGGGVFYLYNKVDDIAKVAMHLKELVPEARIGIGHGQMDKKELEKNLLKFINLEYNVFVCTTIIETGIDLPDTNTLIIHDADKLGLSQMYQIRGRVGRSNKIAYAYMMYKKNKILTENAEKRLKTIKEYTDLGSGYKIAMRDLNIRGAGDLLGMEQSGFVESIGIDTYMKILEEEIKKKKEVSVEVNEIKEKKDTSMNDIMFNRYIPENYISNEDIKVEMHKKIAKINTYQDLENLSLEFIDRFGKYDKDLLYYMYEKLFDKLSDKLDIYKKTETKNSVVLWMSRNESRKMNGQHIFNLTNRFKGIKPKYANQEMGFEFVKYTNNSKSWIIDATKFLDQI